MEEAVTFPKAACFVPSVQVRLKEAAMAKYRVTLTEFVTTTYEVEAEDEEDAFDVVHCGGVDDVKEIGKEVEEADEFGPPEDTAVLVEEEGLDMTLPPLTSLPSGIQGYLMSDLEKELDAEAFRAFKSWIADQTRALTDDGEMLVYVCDWKQWRTGGRPLD